MFDLKEWSRPSAQEELERSRAYEECTEESGEERRGEDRACLHAAVSASSESNFFTGFSENISEGGIFIATLAPPAVGTSLDVAIQVGSGDPLLLSGVVAWIRTDEDDNHTGCGVRFGELTDHQHRQVSALVKQAGQEPLFYEV